MRRTRRCAWVLAAALWGCIGAVPGPAPVVLSYPGEAQAENRFEGYRRLAEKVSGAYVRVVVHGATEDEGMPATAVVSGASGTIVESRGYVVTSAHVARNVRYRARITTLDGRVRPGRIVDVDTLRDLALIRIEPFRGMQAASMAASGRLCAGQPVLAIGTPDNRAGVVSPGRITVPRHREPVDFGEYALADVIEIRMEVGPGHSGGPLFDAEGRLVGIIAGFGLGDTRRVPYVSTRIAYAVPSDALIAYLAEIVGPLGSATARGAPQRHVKACDG